MIEGIAAVLPKYSGGACSTNWLGRCRSYDAVERDDLGVQTQENSATPHRMTMYHLLIEYTCRAWSVGRSGALLN